jgi:hypothetical protein
MPYPAAVTLLSSALRTASGVGASVDLRPVTTPATPPRTTLVLDLVVSAVSGTAPTLDVLVQTSPDGANWRQAWPFALASAPVSVQKRIPALDRYVRAAWTIGGGTPSFTFALTGEALVVLATPAELATKGVNAKALANVPIDLQDEWLEDASVEALEALGGRYALPLVFWSRSVRKYVCQIAAADGLVPRGLGPQDAKILIDQKDRALARLGKISAEQLDPQGMMTDSTSTYDAGAFVSSKPRRGW